MLCRSYCVRSAKVLLSNYWQHAFHGMLPIKFYFTSVYSTIYLNTPESHNTITCDFSLQRLKRYGHVERKDIPDWVSACRKLQAEVIKNKGRRRRSSNGCVKVDMKRLGLVKDDSYIRDKWKGLTTWNRTTLPQCRSFMHWVLVTLNVNYELANPVWEY